MNNRGDTAFYRTISNKKIPHRRQPAGEQIKQAYLKRYNPSFSKIDYTTSEIGLASHTLEVFYGKIQSEKAPGWAVHDADLSGHGRRQAEI